VFSVLMEYITKPLFEVLNVQLKNLQMEATCL
jgi:hypothetical protein